MAHSMYAMEGDFDSQAIVDSYSHLDGDYPTFYDASGDFGLEGEEGVHIGMSEFDMGRSPFQKRPVVKKPTPFQKRPVVKKPTPFQRVAAQRTTVPRIAPPKKVVPKPRPSIKTLPKGLTKAPALVALSKNQPRTTVPLLKNRIGIFPMPKKPINFTPQVVKKSISTIPQPVKHQLVTIPRPKPPINVVPKQQMPQVVSTGGLLTATKISQANEKAEALMTARPLKAAHQRSALQHPLLMFAGGSEMGDMGFLKNLLSDAKKAVQSEADKLKKKLEADAKARVGSAIANVGGTILKKPEVQKVLAEQAKQSTAKAVAERLLDPATQKKAAIGGLGLMVALGAGAYFLARR